MRPPDAEILGKEPEEIKGYKIMEFYSATHHAIFGSDAMLSHARDIFKKLGSFKFAPQLSYGKGWTFPLVKLDPLKQSLETAGLEYIVKPGPKADQAAQPKTKRLVSRSASKPVRRARRKVADQARLVLRPNKYNRHEDKGTRLLFKDVGGVVTAFGVQDKTTDAILPISVELAALCDERRWPYVAARVDKPALSAEDSASEEEGAGSGRDDASDTDASGEASDDASGEDADSEEGETDASYESCSEAADGSESEATDGDEASENED